MIMRDVISWGGRSFSLHLHWIYSFRLASCVSVWRRCTSCLPTSSSFVQTWSLMTSVSKSAVLQNDSLFELFDVYSRFLFFLLLFSFAYLYRAVLAAPCLLPSVCSDLRYAGAWFVFGYGGRGELAGFPVVICSAAVKVDLQWINSEKLLLTQ